MFSTYATERVTGVEQLFMRRRPDSTVGLLVTEVVNYFFLAGLEIEIQ